MSERAAPAIRVVAGVIRDELGRVLIAQRPPGKAHAGLWEFPGGKVEPGESDHEALGRELDEELGIRVAVSLPLRRTLWHYPGLDVELIVLEVKGYRGEPEPRHAAALRWVRPLELLSIPMPEADRPTALSLALPRIYAITPEPGVDHAAFLHAFERTLISGVRLIQLRARQLGRPALGRLAIAAREIAQRHGALLLLNGDAELASETGCDGVHLRSTQLTLGRAEARERCGLVAASCHDGAELERARALGVDFATLSPVCATRSHAGVPALGWLRLAELCAICEFPVYALGGMARGDLDMAEQHGAFGIAGISSFWAPA